MPSIDLIHGVVCLILIHELQIGPDMLISGFLQPVPDQTPVIPSLDETSAIDPTVSPYEPSIIFFYKTWDPYGAFSNFSPHPIRIPDDNGDYITWSSVEHYYQVSCSVSKISIFYSFLLVNSNNFYFIFFNAGTQVCGGE